MNSMSQNRNYHISLSDASRAVLQFFHDNLNGGNIQFGDVIRGTAREAKKLGFAELKFDDGSDFLNHEYAHVRTYILSIVWRFITQGLIVPGHPGDQNSSWPWLTITEYGKKSFKETAIITPFDPDGYIQHFEKIAQPSQIVKLYLTEALQCFISSCFIAATAMLGNVSEAILLEIMDKFRGCLKNPKEYERKVIQLKFIKQKWDAFSKYLATHRTSILQADNSLESALDQYIPNISTVIRLSRNDTGHPTGRNFDRDETEALFYLFPHYYKAAYSLIRLCQSGGMKL